MPFKHTALVEKLTLVCLAFVFLLVCLKRHDDSLPSLIGSDTKGYYMYLPAVFVHKNIHALPDQNFQGRNKNDKGESYTKYTCGVAYFYLPFFLGAHLYAHSNHLECSGFSTPYSYGIMLCGIFWAFIGLYVLKELLLRYFGRAAVWITLLAIMLGTNFFNYASYEVGMSHVYNFTLFASIILATDEYYKAPRKRLAILIGILAGWIVLTRPTNAVLLLFLLLYRITTIKDLKTRIGFLKARYMHVLLAIPFFMLIMLPQLLYWKEMTGHWLKYSYEGEGFIYWAHPKIAEVLFDTANGLFIYSPALLFMPWAIVRRSKDARTSAGGVTIVFVLITYIFASWWAWMFGGAFGHRCYVDYLPVFAFPMAMTMEKILTLRNRFARYGLLALLLLFCYYTVALAEKYMYMGRIWGGDDWVWNWDKWIGLVKEIF